MCLVMNYGMKPEEHLIKCGIEDLSMVDRDQ